MIDTREYRNYNNFWYQALYILRHPIEFIWTFKDNMYNWPDPANTIRKYWMKLYIRLPFQKPCRWLGNMLIRRICNSKLLDTFECRTRDKNIKYYKASCAFGRIKFYEIVYTQRGKTINMFMKVVNNLLSNTTGKKNTETIRITKKLIYSGWVFTKNKAEKTFKEVVKNNFKLYKSKYQNYPTASCPWWLELPDRMTAILETGNFKSYDSLFINNVLLEETFIKTKDNIVKLWCYVTDLLTCCNDFGAHVEIANIANACSWYMFAKARQKDPTIDSFYTNLVKEGKKEQAENYLKAIKSDEKRVKKKTVEDLHKDIKVLKDKYLSMPYEYYRI